MMRLTILAAILTALLAHWILLDWAERTSLQTRAPAADNHQ